MIGQLYGYDVRKAAQVAAYFVSKETGGTIPVLKLVKLIYLADRLFMEKYDCPILRDQLVSMDHGPVNSITLDYINGCRSDPDWDEYISARNDYSIGLAKEISDEDLDQLSNAEIDVLSETWCRYGSMNKYQIRDFTHQYCKEWENPHGSSMPISYERVFKFLNKKDAEALEEKINTERFLDQMFTCAG